MGAGAAGWWQLLAEGIKDTAQFGFDYMQGHKNRSQMDKVTALNIAAAKELNQMNIDYQEKFAKEGIQWKVADAKKAGLHPLAALGASTNSFTPVTALFARQPKTYNEYGRLGKNIGQSLYNAISRIQLKKDLQTIRNMELSNEELELEVERKRKLNNAISESGTRVDGVIQGQSDSIGVDYSNRKAVKQITPGIQPGVDSLENYSQDSDKYLWLKPTQENSEVLESSWFDQFKYVGYRMAKIGKAYWYYYNNTSKGAREHRAHIRSIRPKAPKGYHYRFNPLRGFRLYSNKYGVKFYEKDPPKPTPVYRYDKYGRARGSQKIMRIIY